MYCVKKITEDMYWIGASDRRLELFENVYPIPKGVSYNSYVILDEKTVLLDTVDHSVCSQFLENLEHVLDGRTLDYIIVNHMEPDHCASLAEVVIRYPEVKFVGNAKTFTMMKQFFDFDVDNRAVVIKEGDTISTGKHTLAFAMIPMVHWPEAMVTYDAYDKVLYSADAFGTFGALNGNIFADELNFEAEWLEEARRYLTNIVGKYGAQVQSALKKAAALGRTLILGCKDVEVAKAALEVCKDGKPVLNGATAANYAAMSEVATAAGVVLGVAGADLNETYDTVAALEKAGNKNLVIDATGTSVKEAYANAVQIRRASVKDQDRTFGYPTIVNVAALAHGDRTLQQALASLFTVKYGSIVVMETLDYAEALPLFGLRQNVFTDPQKPMKVEPGIYPLNGADENSICLTTVDFALTYFVVSGELERSGVPCNLIISDAGGLSVLTAWAAGKLSSTSVANYIQENVEGKVKSRKLVIPGKVAVLKGDIEAKLPGWEIIVAPLEAVQLVKFLKDLTA